MTIKKSLNDQFQMKWLNTMLFNGSFIKVNMCSFFLAFPQGMITLEVPALEVSAESYWIVYLSYSIVYHIVNTVKCSLDTYDRLDI